jgi:hypothetical protein
LLAKNLPYLASSSELNASSEEMEGSLSSCMAFRARSIVVV